MKTERKERNNARGGERETVKRTRIFLMGYHAFELSPIHVRLILLLFDKHTHAQQEQK